MKRLFAYIRRKRKEHTAKKNTFERIVQNYSDEWTESKHRAFYAFLWAVINPNDMEDYIVMFNEMSQFNVTKVVSKNGVRYDKR